MIPVWDLGPWWFQQDFRIEVQAVSPRIPMTFSLTQLKELIESRNIIWLILDWFLGGGN